MVQDFAKLRAAAAPDKTPPPAPANKTLLFTGLLTGMALGVFGCFLVYLSGVLPPVGEPGQQPLDAAALAEEQAAAQQKLNEDLERAAAQLQLEFYQELPNYEVIVNTLPESPSRQQPARAAPPAATATASETGSQPGDAGRSREEEVLARTIAELTGAAPVAPVSNTGGVTYMVQAGAFTQEPAAISQSKRLIALGLDSRVKKEALLGKTLFLVQAGPYQNREQLNQVERILRSNNIDSMRITLGGL